MLNVLINFIAKVKHFTDVLLQTNEDLLHILLFATLVCSKCYKLVRIRRKMLQN
jgi:hypothetical protein